MNAAVDLVMLAVIGVPLLLLAYGLLDHWFRIQHIKEEQRAAVRLYMETGVSRNPPSADYEEDDGD